MKKLFKGAVPTIALLLVAIISLSSVTYAWFTAGSEATVDTITVKVEDVNGLLVSSTGYNGEWGSVLTPSIVNASAKLTNVSTAGELFKSTEVGAGNTYDKMSAGDIKFYSVEYDNAYDAFTKATILDTAYGASTTGYYKFTMYVKNDGEALTVSLDGSTVGTNLSSLAARIALVNMGTASSTAALNNGASPAVSGTPSLIGIWEPSTSTHTQNGETWLSNYYGDTQTNWPTSYMAVNAEITKAANDSLEAYTNVATGEVFTINNGVITLAALTGTDTTYDSTDVPTYTVVDPNNTAQNIQEGGQDKKFNYYVYTATTSYTDQTSNHFRLLKITDFFKAAAIDEMITKQTSISDEINAFNSAKQAMDQAASDARTALGIAPDATIPASTDTDACDTPEKVTAVEAYEAALSNYGTNKTTYESAVAGITGGWDYYTFDSTNTVYTKVEANTVLTYNTPYFKKATVGYKAESGSTTNVADVKAYKKTDNVSLEEIDCNDNSGTAYNDASKLKFTVAKQTIEKIDVYIWLEGQDCDCTNYVAGIDFTVDLKFKKVTQ